jgi:uncharacterized membrane protein YdfJ with MMPL/SSD domain
VAPGRSIAHSVDDRERASGHYAVANATDLDKLTSQLVVRLPPMIDVSQHMQTTMRSTYSTFNGLIITQTLIASFVVVGTVVLSPAESFRLVWLYVVGREVHWMTLVFSVFILQSAGKHPDVT